MKHFLVYQIKNLLNDKIYVGVHKTNDINDDYMGSGTRIKQAIEKYGLENFEKTILKECKTEKEMFALEAEIVNDEFLLRNDTYNLKLGGNGGWDHFSTIPELREARDKRMSELGKSCTDIPLTEKHKEKISNSVKIAIAEGRLNLPTGGTGFAGKSHSEESKKKISENSVTRVDEIEYNRRKEIYDSIDWTKRGAMMEYSRQIGISHTQARKFILRNFK